MPTWESFAILMSGSGVTIITTITTVDDVWIVCEHLSVSRAGKVFFSTWDAAAAKEARAVRDAAATARVVECPI